MAHTHAGMEALAGWQRKHYRWRVEFFGGEMPGDGVSITLQGGGREVVVDDIDLQVDDYCPSTDEVILEAVRRWHADDAVKTYWIHAYPPSGEPSVTMELLARSEAEGRSLVAQYVPFIPSRTSIREIRPGTVSTETNRA